jgi:ATP adenylyltransferase
LPYIVSTKDERPAGCFLCRYVQQDRDAENFVVARGRTTVVVLNRFPYNNGHLLVAPVAHKANLDELDDGELLECMHDVRRMTQALRRIMNPDGFNIGLNLGQVAGAGLPGHLHWHIVPRWSGDTNFMSVVGAINVIPQSLEALHDLLTQELAKTAD